jgi:hypothetical protein
MDGHIGGVVHALAWDSGAAEMRARRAGRVRVSGQTAREEVSGREVGKSWRKEVEGEVEAALDLYLTSAGALA